MIMVYFLDVNRNYYRLHPKRKHGGGASLFRHLVFYPLLRLIAHSKKPLERKIRVTVWNRDFSCCRHTIVSKMSGNIDLVQTFHPKVFFFVIYPIVHVVRLSVCGYLLLGSYTHIFGQEINFKRRKKYLLQLLHNGKMNVEDLELVLVKLLRIKKYKVLAIFLFIG